MSSSFLNNLPISPQLLLPFKICKGKLTTRMHNMFKIDGNWKITGSDIFLRQCKMIFEIELTSSPEEHSQLETLLFYFCTSGLELENDGFKGNLFFQGMFGWTILNFRAVTLHRSDWWVAPGMDCMENRGCCGWVFLWATEFQFDLDVVGMVGCFESFPFFWEKQSVVVSNKSLWKHERFIVDFGRDQKFSIKFQSNIDST